MFTGIIEEIGKVKRIHHVSEQAIQLYIIAEKTLTDLHIGDSVAVNGVCLTVTDFTGDYFQADVMPETIQATSLRQVDIDSPVNLERSVAANGRFGGHFVTGHVDDIGEITRKEVVENAIYYDVKVNPKWMKYFILKGSIAIDGVSLTIFGTATSSVTISLIPHTVSQTVLGEKGVGDIVNIECDMLAKHVEQQLQYHS